MNVPFLDLNAAHTEHMDEFREAFEKVAASSAFAGGPFVQRFEEEYAGFCGAAHCVGVGSGTEALWLALLAMDTGPGDEVITVPNSFIATAEAISFCGAKPVFVDVDERTFTMNPALLEDAITNRTKAIIPVHLYGQTADMDPILAVAARHDLPVLEDAAQAQGARYKDRCAGTLGVAGCFSFYPGKNLGAWGEAGAVVTSNPSLAERITMLRDHGQSTKYHHRYIGWNARMDGIQAAVLSIKLRYLREANEARRKVARRYAVRLEGLPGLQLPQEADYAYHVYHVYAVRALRREHLRESLSEQGVASALHYPTPIHLQKAYRLLGYKPGHFPVAEILSSELLSLPMYPELREEQIDYTAEAMARACRELIQEQDAVVS